VSQEPSLPLPNVPEYWFATPTTVAATPGMHRLIWDLRYPAPRTLPASYYGPILQYTEYTLADHAIPHETPRQQPQGPLVAPGVYTVELSSGSKTQRQQITVQLDPRVHASQADLDDQLKLAQRILGGVATSYEEYQSVAALSTAVEEKAKSQPQATEQLKKQIQEVREGTDKTLGMGAINRDLTRLLNSVESGDEHPTEPQVQAVNQVCAALTKVMGQWKLLNGALRTENPLQLPVRAVPAAAGCNP
jgi:hypothetical protein